MTTIELLQKSIDYIEENLKCEISLSELAEIAGFSTFHFCHIFSDFLGMPVTAFITKRRLHHAIYDIQNGGKLVDTALLYGFDTHAGFFKAFKREFGCSPSKFLKLYTVKKPTNVNLIREAKIMLTQTQIRQLLTNWELESKPEIGITYILGGTIQSKSTWSIGEKYIFKTGKNIAGLRTHIAIAKALEKSSLASATPVKTKSGDDFIVEDDNFYVLTNRIPGGLLTPEERYAGDRIATGKKYGESIGNLHNALKLYDEELEVNDSNLYETVINWAMPNTKKIMEQWDCPLSDDFYSEYIRSFSSLYNKLPCQIIHRDPNPSNILFENGEVSGFIDFDISQRNVRLFDPCYCATGILSEASMVEGSYEMWPDILKGIIYGYDEICKLSDAEKQSVPYVVYSIQMIFIAYLNGQEEFKNMAVQNRNMLAWIWENRDKCFDF
jgi:AraC-like DNA-binding protein/Ser/Thr protein kinase RdoA (MazF antagonist)